MFGPLNGVRVALVFAAAFASLAAFFAGFTGTVHAPGAFRRELTNASYRGGVQWGISMIHKGDTPYLIRWDAKGLEYAPPQSPPGGNK